AIQGVQPHDRQWQHDPPSPAIESPDKVPFTLVDNHRKLVRSFRIDFRLVGIHLAKQHTRAFGNIAGQRRQPLGATEGLNVFVENLIGSRNAAGSSRRENVGRIENGLTVYEINWRSGRWTLT